MKSVDNGATWAPANAGLLNTRVTSITISPNFALDSTLFASTLGGGVFKSVDGAVSWTPMNTGLVNLNVNKVKFTKTSHIFSVTRGAGVYLSTDGGLNWVQRKTGIKPLSHQTTNHFRDIAISATYDVDAVAYTGTFEGLYYTNNGSATWLKSLLMPQTLDRSVAVSPAFSSDNTLFAGTYGGGVLKSTARGDSWTVMNRTLANTYIDPMDLSPGYQADSTILMGSYMSVHKSLNGGVTWSLYPLATGKTFYVRQIVMSPVFQLDHTAYASSEFGQGVFRSTEASAGRR